MWKIGDIDSRYRFPPGLERGSAGKCRHRSGATKLASYPSRYSYVYCVIESWRLLSPCASELNTTSEVISQRLNRRYRRNDAIDASHFEDGDFLFEDIGLFQQQGQSAIHFRNAIQVLLIHF